MTPAQMHQAAAELDLQRRRRELLFWTISATLSIIASVGTTAVFLVSLITGPSLDAAHTAAGAAIMAVTATNARQHLGLLRPADSESPA